MNEVTAGVGAASFGIKVRAGPGPISRVGNVCSSLYLAVPLGGKKGLLRSS